MKIITADFETAYSQTYSLSKLTTQQYIDSHLFEVIGVAVKEDDEETVSYTGDKKGTADFLSVFDWENSALCCHNAMFDASILAWQFGIRPKVILDTLSMARAVHGTEVGGSLAKLAEYYGVGVKGTEVLDAKGKWRKDFSDDELDKYMAYCRNDVDLTREIFKHLLPHFNKTELKLIDMTVRMHSEPQLCLDLNTLEGHLYDVQRRKEDLLSEAGVAKEDLMSNDKFADLLRNMGVEPPTKTSLRTGKEAYAFAKTDEGLKNLLEHFDPDVQAIVSARLGTKSTLEETRTERFIEIAKTAGVLPVPLKYYGADKTGRWSATDKVQLQNIPRTSTLKKAIQAEEGKVIVGADLSNIELRVGLYFAGQMDKVELLANGKDLYRDFIAPIFNVAYEDVDDDQRFIGKTSQLSLIYGTGAKKLRNAIKQMSGKDIGEELANTLVVKYRSEYSAVKRSWYEGEKVLEAVRDDASMVFGSVVELPVEGKSGILMPSGLHMRYSDLQESQDEETGNKLWSYASRRERVKIYGPKVYQNTIQGLARCVMGEAMVRVHKKYPVLLTIHDALYIAVSEEKADEALKFVIRELKKQPVWAPGLPLDAEGGYGKSLSFKMGKITV